MSLFNLLKRKSKKKQIKINNDYLFTNSINTYEIKKVYEVISTFNNYLKQLEQFPYSGNSSLQIKLRKEKILDMARAELLIVAFIYFNSAAMKSKFNSNAGSAITTMIGDYINSLKIRFSSESFNNVEDFIAIRFKDYQQFYKAFQSGENLQYEGSLLWLESIISLRLFKQIGRNEVNRIYYPDFDALNQFAFFTFYPRTMLIPFMNDIDKLFEQKLY